MYYVCMYAVLLIRKYFFIVLLFFIAPTSAFSLDLTCKYVETTMIETFDKNDKSLGVSFGSIAKGIPPKRISIGNKHCIVNDEKYKLFKSDDLFMCSLKERRKDWSEDQYISINRYTGSASVSTRIKARSNTINSKVETRFNCKKGKAKKKF